MYAVNVCGNLCSGKTTLCKSISDAFGMEYIHADVDKSLIESFLKSPREHFLRQQLSILSDKSEKIRRCVESDVDIAVDRSFFEDVEIFAKSFLNDAERYGIGAAVERAYMRSAEKILQDMPKVDLAIYCYAPPELCEARAERRGRGYERLYPPKHFHKLHRMYEKKLSELPCGTLIKLDCETRDITDAAVMSEILNELARLIRRSPAETAAEAAKPNSVFEIMRSTGNRLKEQYG